MLETDLDFQQSQREFLEYVRDPDNKPPLQDVSLERMEVYRDIVYSNIEDFLSNGFPVLRSIYNDDDWQALVSDFILKHQSHSPVFRKMCEEFIVFLQNEREDENDPAFLLELAHYEWAEVVIDRADIEIDNRSFDSTANLLENVIVVSPLIWVLQYEFPVHKIGASFQPSTPGETPTFIIIYRNLDDDEVNFMEVNAITARMVQLLQESHLTGNQLFSNIITEMNHPQPQIIHEKGQEILNMLLSHQILLGAKPTL